MVSRRQGILLVNLGTPDSPTPGAVGRFLKAFLSDPRVIEVPRLIWFFILRLIIVPFRSRRVATLYRGIWKEDSPQRLHGDNLAEQLSRRLDMPVQSAFCYGKPVLTDCLAEFHRQGIEELLVVPLFPQYSSTTVGAAFDALAGWMANQREIPALHFIKDYWQGPAWQTAITDSVRDFQKMQGRPDKLIFSFHGIPQSYADKGDRYPERCRATAEDIAKRLQLSDDEWMMAFQSRFGPSAWVKPYTDELVRELAGQGVKNLQVVCPGFAVDCLETLEEIAERNQGYFIEAGGERLDYIPALNASDGQLAWLTDLARYWLRF